MPTVITINAVEKHYGTLDREALAQIPDDQREEVLRKAILDPQPPYFYDKPGKHEGITKAVLDFADQCLEAAPAPLRFKRADGSPYPELTVSVSERLPTEEQLFEVHSPAYVDMIRSQSARAAELEKEGKAPLVLEGGVEACFSPGTHTSALTAVGATLDAVDAIMADTSTRAFAVVWPPGHHAESFRYGPLGDLAMGYCYYNNVAIAAFHARDHEIQITAGQPNSVGIVGFDNHNDDGIETAVAHQPGMVLVDMRQISPFENGHYVDGIVVECVNQVTGKVVMVRQGQGTEFPPRHTDEALGVVAHPSITAPNLHAIEFLKPRNDRALMVPASTPEEIIERFIREGLPPLEEQDSNVLIIAAGWDSAQNDKLGGKGHIPGSFYTITLGLRVAFPKARMMMVTEGGYNEDNWGPCVSPSVAALHVDMDDPKIRSHLFARYAGAFEKRFRQEILSHDLSVVTEALTARLDELVANPVTLREQQSFREMVKRASDSVSLDSFAAIAEKIAVGCTETYPDISNSMREMGELARTRVEKIRARAAA